MKKLMTLVLALILALVMMLGMVSFASAEEYNMPEMTTEEITLTFMTWDDFEMTEALAAKFMEKYPNIHVEILRTTTGDIAGELLNRAAENNLPDVYFWLDLEPLMAGKYMYDFTEYIENDEELNFRARYRKRYPALRDDSTMADGEFFTASRGKRRH